MVLWISFPGITRFFLTGYLDTAHMVDSVFHSVLANRPIFGFLCRVSGFPPSSPPFRAFVASWTDCVFSSKYQFRTLVCPLFVLQSTFIYGYNKYKLCLFYILYADTFCILTHPASLPTSWFRDYIYCVYMRLHSCALSVVTREVHRLQTLLYILGFFEPIEYYVYL